MPAATVTPLEGEPGSPKGRIVSSVAGYSQDKVTLHYKQNDCTLSDPSHPRQGSLRHAAGPTPPNAECQTSQNDLPPSSRPPRASTTATPNVTLTKPRVHNPYALKRLALRTGDVVDKRGALVLSPVKLWTGRSESQPGPLLVSVSGEMIPYLDFTPITISFLGRATVTVFRSCLTGKESRAGRM